MAKGAARTEERQRADRLPPLPATVGIGESLPARQALPRCAPRPAAALPPALALLLHAGAIAGLLSWQVESVQPPAPDEIAFGLTFAADPPVPNAPPTAAPLPDLPVSEPPAVPQAAPPEPTAPSSDAEAMPAPVAPTPPPALHEAPAPRPVAHLTPARPRSLHALATPQDQKRIATHAVGRQSSAAPSSAAIVAPAAPSPLSTPVPEAPRQAATLVGGMVGAGCAPRYPEAALRSGQQGLVLMRVGVGADGAPTDVAVVTSSGSPRLDGAAADALRHCHFRPATAGGRPIAGMAEVAYRFRLEN